MKPRSGPGRSRAISCSVIALCFSSIAGLSFGGCSFDREAPQANIDTPSRFQAGTTRAAQKTPDDWPSRFGSKELGALVNQARAQNLDILTAVARIEQAEAQARVTSATLYPTIAAGAGGSTSRTPGVARTVSPPYNSLNDNLYGLNLNATYELDFWGKNRDNADSARLLAHASRFDRDVIALSTTASVVNSYFQVLAAQDRLHVAQKNVATAEKVLAAIKGRVEVGTATSLDEAQQATIVAQQRANVPPLEQTELQTRNILAVLLGRTPESTHLKGGSLERLTIPAVAAGLPSQLLLRRPDLAEVEDKLMAQGLEINVARAAFYPDVTLTGSFGVESMLLKSLLSPQAAAFSLAGNIAQPIFNGGALQGQLDLQKSLYKELLFTYRKQILTAFSDVENGLIGLDKTGRQVELQRQAVVQAQKAYDVALGRLQEGTIDIVTLATIETTLFQAEDLLVQVRSAHFQAATTLYQALGGGWTQPPHDPDVQAAIANQTG